MSIDFIRPEVDELRPRISVIGVGGAGGNAIANMIRSDVQGVQFLVANTDAQAKLDAAIGERSVERLRVGVGDDEIDSLDVGAHHVGDRITSSAADADDADPGTKFVDFRPDEINAHALIPPQSCNTLSLQHESMNHPESSGKRKC